MANALTIIITIIIDVVIVIVIVNILTNIITILIVIIIFCGHDANASSLEPSVDASRPERKWIWAGRVQRRAEFLRARCERIQPRTQPRRVEAGAEMDVGWTSGLDASSVEANLGRARRERVQPRTQFFGGWTRRG